MSLFQGTMVLARKEIREHFTSKRFFIIGGLFALSIVIATTVGARLFRSIEAQGGGEGFSGGDAVPAILNLYLGVFQGIFLLKLLALVLAADAIVSEWKDRTLFLLLSKPITRTAMLTGKILSAYAIVLMLLVAGFGIALLVLVIDVGMPGAQGWGRILGGLAMLAAGLLPFVALATMFSSLFKSTATSYTISIILVVVVLPLIFSILQFVVFLNSDNRDPQALVENRGLQILALVDPSTFLNAASYVMIGAAMSASSFGFAERDLGEVVISSFIAMAIHLGVYLGVSYWVVNRRDYA